jgi:DNA-binding transcriptional regulator/RsmH inhibitor MraZ
MLKTEKIKKEIDILPKDMLKEVERFIKNLKSRKKTARKKSSLLSELAEVSTDIDMPVDFSKQHDHYLYGIPKK